MFVTLQNKMNFIYKTFLQIWPALFFINLVVVYIPLALIEAWWWIDWNIVFFMCYKAPFVPSLCNRTFLENAKGLN